MSKFGEWELVIVWDTNDTDVYGYKTREEAEVAGRNMKMALGNQIAWYGTRESKKKGAEKKGAE